MFLQYTVLIPVALATEPIRSPTRSRSNRKSINFSRFRNISRAFVLEISWPMLDLFPRTFTRFHDFWNHTSHTSNLSFSIPGTNVALRRPANQSTSVRGGAASNANDGDKTTVHDGKKCTETMKEASPWWQVDLLRPYPIRVVRITTRGCCGKAEFWTIRSRIILDNKILGRFDQISPGPPRSVEFARG